MENEEKIKITRNRCAICNSTMTYFRLKDGCRVCRTCGNIQKVEQKEEQLNG